MCGCSNCARETVRLHPVRCRGQGSCTGHLSREHKAIHLIYRLMSLAVKTRVHQSVGVRTLLLVLKPTGTGSALHYQGCSKQKRTNKQVQSQRQQCGVYAALRNTVNSSSQFKVQVADDGLCFLAVNTQGHQSSRRDATVRIASCMCILCKCLCGDLGSRSVAARMLTRPGSCTPSGHSRF